MTQSTQDLVITFPSDREIKMTRLFDAPRDLVFEAHTSCEHMQNWWGPRKYRFVDCKIDFREGGAWRVVHADDEGNEFEFYGEYREIVRPDRITWTFEFGGAPGQVAVETLTLAEEEGMTRLTAVSVFDSREARDAMAESGMEEGARETWDRLAEYVSRMQ